MDVEKMDKVTLQVFANHARAAAENMAYTLYRTAHSTFVKETEDFTVQLTDPAGSVFAVPLDLGATWYPGIYYGDAMAMIPEYEPGDIDYYLRNVTHYLLGLDRELQTGEEIDGPGESNLSWTMDVIPERTIEPPRRVLRLYPKANRKLVQEALAAVRRSST